METFTEHASRSLVLEYSRKQMTEDFWMQLQEEDPPSLRDCCLFCVTWRSLGMTKAMRLIISSHPARVHRLYNCRSSQCIKQMARTALVSPNNWLRSTQAPGTCQASITSNCKRIGKIFHKLP